MPLPEPEYKFVPDTELYVSIIHGQRLDVGRLDREGNFVPDRRWVNVQGWFPHTPPSYVINSPPSDSVYEFRSGFLIPGSLDGKGNFVPKLGGKIIAFKDYRYSEKAPKIWNLPGRFVKTTK